MSWFSLRRFLFGKDQNGGIARASGLIRITKISMAKSCLPGAMAFNVENCGLCVFV
jgi:hypothetical protein